MKIKWSVFYSLILLITLGGCGKEQFGTVPKSTSENASALVSFSQNTCSTYTLIKPKVDILYVVDNSASSYYIANDIRSALNNTVNRLSTDFDFRVIGTPLLETASGNNDYQVMTNSSDLTGIPSDSRRISSSNEFSFFSNSPILGIEKGLHRVSSFISSHQNSLLRAKAHLVVVLVSNGRDLEIEEDAGFGNGETTDNVAKFNERLTTLRNLKTSLNLATLRMISITAHTVCQPGYRRAEKSYVKMSEQLYADAAAADSSVQDSHDLCVSGGISSIFASINSSIKQVVLPHKYRFMPITFADNNISFSDLKVKKVSASGSVELVRDTDWTYVDQGSVQSVNTRELPTPGEPVSARHFVRFTNLVTYPDCIVMSTVSKTEYFGYVVLPQKPKPNSITLEINGVSVPKSATNGWSDETATPKTINIKVPFPNAGDENPPVIRTGFMLKLNGSGNYYKSGDKVEVKYEPAPI